MREKGRVLTMVTMAVYVEEKRNAWELSDVEGLKLDSKERTRVETNAML